MSRLLLLSILVLWMCPRDNVSDPAWWPAPARVGLFVGVYAALVLVMSLWSRLLARRVGGEYLGKTLDRYNRATELARYFVPVWFAVGLFGLGWGHVVETILPVREPFRTPAMLLGTLPAFAAWMGLWWAQYPADRALKEQSVIYQANEGLPIHAPPGFATFFVEHFRQQLLFTLAPILLIIACRDLLAGAFVLAGSRIPHNSGDLLFFPVSVGIFLLAPELLRRVIPTKPLPATWPLRRRLEVLCERAGLKYRDILLWQTNSSMGNAMVMGLFPRVRYVFLSDLLIETMRDEEIEAVFAHEIGHIVHRHMWWYLVFTVILMLFSMGPLSLALNHIPGLTIYTNMTDARQAELAAYQEQIAAAVGFLVFVVCFGFVSRRFERQADVYAARTMQAHVDHPRPVVISHVNPETQAVGSVVVEGGLATTPIPTATLTHAPAPSAAGTHVGQYGASVVGGALHRVARINNIPVAAGEWLHGSIASRMRYLHGLSEDATGTARFDRYMRRLYWGLVALLVGLGAWVYVQFTQAGGLA